MATSVGTIKVDATLSTASFIKSLNGLEAAANKAVSNMAKSLQSSNATFTGIGKSLQASISSGVNNAAKAIRNLPGTVANGVKSIPDTVANGVKSIPTTVGNAVRSAGNAFNNLPGTAARAIGNVVSTAQRELPNIANAAQDVMKKVGGILSSAAKIGAGAFTAATTAIVGQATKAYSDYQQLTGGVAKLYGDSAGVVEANAKQAFKTAGLSANDYMDTVTSFSASLISGLGGNTAQAANIADKAVRDMSDNANTFGTSMSSIQYAYQGFAKQNYTMLDNLKLGYGGTASEMARLVNDSGVMGDSFHATAENINNVSFDKIIEAIHVTQERMKITGTTANEASSTVEGSINSMKGSWTNLLTALGSGKDVDDAMKNFMDSLQGVVKNVAPVVGTVFSGIIQAIPTLLPQLVTQLSNLFTQLVPKLGAMIQSLAQQLPAMVQTLVMAITNPNVIQSVVSAGVALITALIGAFTNPTTYQAMLNGAIQLMMALIEAIPTIVEAFANAIPNIINVVTRPENIAKMAMAAGTLFMAIVQAVPTILGALIKAFGNLVSNLWRGIKGLFSDIGGKIGDTVSGAIKGVINGALGLLESFLNGPINLINGALDLINKLPGVNVGKIGRIKLPRMATGGYVDGVGTGTSDSNMAWLSRGEYVVKADTVRRYGVEFMDALNNGSLAFSGGMTQNYYYQFDRNANSRWQYQQIRTGAAA